MKGLFSAAGTKYLCTPKKIEHRLSMPIGDILVQEGGVTCRLEEPLSRMSRYYPWRYVPSVLEGFCALATGEGDPMVFALLREGDKDTLEKSIGRVDYSSDDEFDYIEHDSDVLESVQRLLEWMPVLASQSPKPVAERLTKLRS